MKELIIIAAALLCGCLIYIDIRLRGHDAEIDELKGDVARIDDNAESMARAHNAVARSLKEMKEGRK